MAATELEQNLEDDKSNINKHSVEERFDKLSSQLTTANKEKDEAAKKAAEAEAKLVAEQKKAGFYKDFSRLSGKYQGAADHLEEIESKVMAGYDAEDATISVLAKAGKLTTPAVERESPAGGSATTVTPRGDFRDKKPSEMTQEERRAAIQQADDEGDPLISSLRR